MEKQIKVKLVRSTIGSLPKHALTVRGLGLSKVGADRWLNDTPAIRGMAKTVPHLVTIIEEKGGEAKKTAPKSPAVKVANKPVAKAADKEVTTKKTVKKVAAKQKAAPKKKVTVKKANEA